MRDVIARAAALILLGLLAGDLTDTSCDPLILPGNVAIVAATAEGPSDPCDGACVPDCFCCSSCVAGIRLSPVAQSIDSLAVDASPTLDAAAGFLTPPDHVPLAIL